MDQYLLIPFLGGWTSINPSYFDVNYRGTIGFDTLPYDKMWRISSNDAIDQTWGHTDLDEVSGPGCAPWCFFGCQQGPLAMNMW